MIQKPPTTPVFLNLDTCLKKNLNASKPYLLIIHHPIREGGKLSKRLGRNKKNSLDGIELVFPICVCVCVFSSHSFWTSSSLDVPAGVTQEEGHTGFLTHLLSAVRAFIFLARRIQPFLSLVDREVEFCVLTILIVLRPLGIFSFSFSFFSEKNPVCRHRTHVPTCQKVTWLPLSYRGDRLSNNVCVCVLPIHSGHQVRWTYQSGSHRRKVTQDFSSTFFLRCVPLFLSREGFSHSFPLSTVKSNFVY